MENKVLIDTKKRLIRLGTRGSKLAMVQAESVKARLKGIDAETEVEIVPIRTSGDRGLRETLGAFVKEIQEALLRDEVDVALHCLKDLPTQQVEGLEFAAYLPREDPRDAMISRCADWHSLPQDAVIGTGSVRRTSQLKARQPHLQSKPLVGNVDTRLRKLRDGEYDAIVLAIAGLSRLGWLQTWPEEYSDLTVAALDLETMLPAPGQAVLVLETRSDDAGTSGYVRVLHDPKTEACAESERAFLQAFGGGCSVPVAAHCTAEESGLKLKGLVASPDGSRVVKGDAEGTEGVRLGKHLGEKLISYGAADLFQGGI